MKAYAILGIFAVIGACGKKKSDDSSTSNTGAGEVQTTLAQAYPGNLALSVFPTDTTSTAQLLADADAVAPESLKKKAAEAEGYIKGTAEKCLPPIFLRPDKSLEETCYEFDQEMLSGTKDSRANGTLDGKSKLAGSTEACLVSFARAKIKEIEGYIDQGLGLQQGMICQAVKDKVDVAPATTEAGLDLKNTLSEATESTSDARKPAITVDEAKMSKDADGVYRVSISVSMTKNGKTISQTYKLSHVPDNSDNSAYHGVMSITRNEPSNPGNQTQGKRYISVSYTKETVDSVSRLKTELRSARMDTSLDASAFNDDGTLNYNAGADASGNYTGFTEANKAVSSMVFVGFDLNSEDDTGNFEYWQNPGANYSEPARGMVFKLDKNASTGRLEGCGMSGAALGAQRQDSMSIRKAIKTGTRLDPTGSFHPFFHIDAGGSCTGSDCTRTVNDPSGTYTATWKVPPFIVPDNVTAAADWAKKQQSFYVTRQCVAQTSAGVYEIDSVKTPDAAGYELFNPTSRTELVIAKPDRPTGPPAGSK
jgi:hypothetical protein